MSGRRIRGFTLIELLIATVIVSVMVVLAFNGLRLGIASWDAVSERAESSERMRVVLDLLRRQLEQAREVRASEPGERAIEFAGTRDALRFVAPMPGRLGLGGLYRLTLEARGYGARRDLVLSYELQQGDDWARLSDDLAGEVILHENVRGIEVAYFGSESGRGSPRWRDRWEDAQRLPALIRVRVQTSQEARETWPELVVAPRAGAAGAS